MTIAFGANGVSGNGTTSCGPGNPNGVTAGQMLLLHVTNKYPNNAPSDPSGWTFLARYSGGAGASGADSGAIYTTVWWRVADGTESLGVVTVTVTSGNSCIGKISRWTKDQEKGWATPVAVGGSDNNAADTVNFAVTADDNPGVIAGDMIIVFGGNNTDAAAYSGQTITETGATFGAVTEAYDNSTTSGDDVAHQAFYALCTAGPGSAAV